MRNLKGLGITAGILLIFSVFLGCEADSTFQVSDTLPDFTMPDQFGEARTLSDELDQPGINGAVLAFYILDNTPG